MKKLELTPKARALGITLVVLILVGFGVSIFKHSTKPTQDADDHVSNEYINASLLGDWFSTREQGDHLVLHDDGSFESNWLGSGTYTVDATQLHLVGQLNLTAELIYDETLDILSCTSPESHRYYRTEAQAETAIQDELSALQHSDIVLEAKNILLSGTWETHNGPKSLLTFTNGKLKNLEPDSPDNPVNQTYDYVIDSAEQSTNEMIVNMTIIMNDKENTLQSVKIGLKNEGDGVYTLTKYSQYFLSSGNKWFLEEAK